MDRALPFGLLRALARDQRGLTTVEYVIVLALIAVVAVSTWQTFGDAVKGYLINSSDAIGAEMAKGPAGEDG